MIPSLSPSGPLMDQRLHPSYAEFHSVSPRPDLYRSTLPKDKSTVFPHKPALGSKRIRESAQPSSTFTAPVQSAPSAVIGTPLDYRPTPAATSLLPQFPSAYYSKQHQLHEPSVPRDMPAQLCSASDTSSPVSPIDGGFGTDCSDDLDSGAESPSQTIELAGGGRLQTRSAQGPSLYHWPAADGGAAPFPVQSATQMRPPVSGSILCELVPRAEESGRPVTATVNWTSPYGASGFAFTSPTVTPVSARVPTFFPRKLSTESNSTELKQPSFPFDLSDPFSLCSSVGDHTDASADLSSLSSASPVPPDCDGQVQNLSDGGFDSDTDGGSPLKRARLPAASSGPIVASEASPAPPPSCGFKCRVCSRSLRTEAHLASHMGVHTGERPCECPTCGQGFKTSTDLSNHARTHSADKPFECAACSKAFKRRWELTRHMRVHTQDARPFECSECGKFFQTKTTLASHMRIHSDDKPFGCSVCAKTFKRKGELTLHMRTHTGERPFKCPYCHKGFKQKGTLTQHLPTHTDSRPFTCAQCSSHFKHKSSLTRHVRCHKAAEAMAAMGVPAQLRAQLQMRLELDVLKSESQPVDTVAADAQLPESDSEWLEACLKSTLSSAVLPMPLPMPIPSVAVQDPELDPALTCFQCQIPFDHVSDLAAHISESHPLPLSVTEPPGPAPEHMPAPVVAALPSASPIAVPALPVPESSTSSAQCVRFDSVFGPRAQSSKSAVSAKKQPNPIKAAHEASKPSAKGSSGHFCSSCGKHFKHKYSLSRHTAKHHNHGGVWALAACPMCAQSFDSASLLSRHMVAAHGPSARPSLSSSSAVPFLPSPAPLSGHYSVSPAGDLARTFLFDGEAPSL